MIISQNISLDLFRSQFILLNMNNVKIAINQEIIEIIRCKRDNMLRFFYKQNHTNLRRLIISCHFSIIYFF